MPRRTRCARPVSKSTVYGVPAYSTLGKLDWLGGDPLLNTFINWPEGELARLIFHELSHQVVVRRRRHDVQRILRHRGRAHRRGALAGAARERGARDEYAALDARRVAVPRADRAAPASASTRSTAAAPATPTSASGKAALMSEYARRVRDSEGRALGRIRRLRRLVRARQQRLARRAGRLQRAGAAISSACSSAKVATSTRFYAAVRRLADLPKAERQATLRAI